MKLIFYEVDLDGAEAIEGVYAASTLEHAKKVRAGTYYPYGEITKIVTADLPARELAVALFNREGYSAESTVVFPCQTRRREFDRD